MFCCQSWLLTMDRICSDLYALDMRRGRALLAYNMATTGGSILGPMISGWAVMSIVGWRLSFWIGLGTGGIAFLGVLLGMPESNHNVILDKRAKQIRNSNTSWKPQGPTDGDEKGWKYVVTKILTRPLTMLYREPLVFFTCMYLAFQYSLLYIFFQSYPIVFEGASSIPRVRLYTRKLTSDRDLRLQQGPRRPHLHWCRHRRPHLTPFPNRIRTLLPPLPLS